MKAEIISIVKDKEDIVLQVRCSPPSRVYLWDTSRLKSVGKTRKFLSGLFEDNAEGVEKRDKEIAEYKRQQSRFRLSYIEIRDIGQ